MYYQVIAFGFLVTFFSLILLFLYLGMLLARWKPRKRVHDQAPSLQVVEGAIFALLALLVTFTFSSAYQKFDARRYLITEEANAIRTAYLRINLTSPETQPILRQYFKNYLSLQLTTYEQLPDLNAYALEHIKAESTQKKIWNLVAQECDTKGEQAVCMLLLPALNTMFDIANTRYANADIHPPLIIFILLVGLALLGALLAGYDIGEREKGTFLYLMSYGIVISVTVYIIIDLEFPRLGLIRVDSFDEVLEQVQQYMN